MKIGELLDALFDELIGLAFEFVLVQLVEGNVLVPLVMRNTIGLSPFLVIVSLLVGAAAGGVVGALFAVPIAAASLVILNRFPYQNGHLMVAPRRHTASLAALPEPEHRDLAETLRRSIDTVAATFHPDGFNLGMNLGAAAGAGVVDHLHWHIVPRWAGDTNFMAAVAETRVIPQHLLETYDRLRAAFDWLE